MERPSPSFTPHISPQICQKIGSQLKNDPKNVTLVEVERHDAINLADKALSWLNLDIGDELYKDETQFAQAFAEKFLRELFLLALSPDKTGVTVVWQQVDGNEKYVWSKTSDNQICYEHHYEEGPFWNPKIRKGESVPLSISDLEKEVQDFFDHSSEYVSKNDGIHQLLSNEKAQLFAAGAVMKYSDQFSPEIVKNAQQFYAQHVFPISGFEPDTLTLGNFLKRGELPNSDEGRSKLLSEFHWFMRNKDFSSFPTSFSSDGMNFCLHYVLMTINNVYIDCIRSNDNPFLDFLVTNFKGEGVTVQSYGNASPLSFYTSLLQSNTSLVCLKMESRLEGGLPEQQCFANVVANHPSLRVLHIGNVGGDDWVEPLSAALHSNKTLHELSLSWSNITNGEQKVAELLEHNNVLKVLKLGFFRSSKQGTEALMQALTNNTSLIELHLATDIGNEEIKVLTRVLTCHPALEVLTFNCTRITDGGVLALANAMKTNKSLRTLDLYSCSTAKCENAVALAEAIENHPTLKELRLDGLKIPSSVAITLLRNKTLTSLSIRDLEFPSDVRGNALAVKDEAKESLLAALNENWVLRSGQFGYSYGQSSLQPALKSCIMRNQEFYSLFLNVVLIKETHGSGVEKGMGIPNEIFGIVVGYLFSLYHHDHTKLTNASNK